MEHLTPREIEIIDLLCQGYTYNDIAHKLVLSINTVKTYKKQVFEKLQVNKIQHLICLVLNGSLPTDASNSR